MYVVLLITLVFSLEVITASILSNLAGLETILLVLVALVIRYVADMGGDEFVFKYVSYIVFWFPFPFLSPFADT